MRVTGADRIGRKLRQMPAVIRDEVNAANRTSAAELVRIAKLLHPGDGATRDGIHQRDVPEGVLVDFGVKAKVTEELRPHINPALKVTRKKFLSRAKRAVNKGVKKAFSGG